MQTTDSEQTILIHNVYVVNADESFPGYVLVRGKMIDCVGQGEPDGDLMAAAGTTIDGRGRLLLPGVIDTHVHFRDPGLTHKADMETESRAAVAGGVTSFLDMPNTKPVTVSMEAVEAKMARASQVSVANYGFFIGATDSNIQELIDADYSRVAGVKLFMGSSTGNMLVNDARAIGEIFTRVPAIVAVHAEDENLLQARRKAVVDRYGEMLPIDFHPVIRDHSVCMEASRRIVEIARRHDHRLHLLHLSTADELSLITPGNPAGKLITAETCPQYLAFCDEQYAMLGSRIKCNPAIKRPADRDALRRAVNEGVIDTIATDHAPHLPEEKQGTALTAASGMPLIQFSLTLMLQMVEEGIFPLATVVREMCHNPAAIYGIERRGFIRKGYYADLVLVDNDCEPYTITDQWAMSRCGWTPLNGLTVSNKVDMTMVNGHIAYRHGIIFAAAKGEPLKFVR